ncbi:hypothetical protein [Defluviimonas sp. WL0075]|uniref:Uncharacterized protein n=1 Tax=Albidovulum sediminicola TaxID=2984331 RepID=A0ABT2Z0U9_9RHOB|nr:hypothetical protein [Defluviimonas sp. WL0075]MCV2864710.1 hypothetical protein [Defluviimonas sp. WL0075]
MRALAHLWREHRLALLVFVGGAVVAVLFAVRLAVFSLYWADPAHRQQEPDGWMTPRYIARSWHVPQEDLARHLDLAPGGDARMTLDDIARARGIPLETLLADLAAYLATRTGE